MALLTLENNVLSGAQGDTWSDWACISHIVFRPTAAGNVLEIDDSDADAVLRPYEALSTGSEKIDMHNKWANGLVLTVLEGASSEVQIHLV